MKSKSTSPKSVRVPSFLVGLVGLALASSESILAQTAPTGNPLVAIYNFGPGATIGPVISNAAAISWTVPFGTNVSNLAPTYSWSPGASCSNYSGSPQNFSSPVHYLVKAPDFVTSGIAIDYTVTVTIAPVGAGYTGSLYILTTPDGADIPAGASETNFPLLIRLNKENFNFAQAQSDGRDIRFTTATGVPMAYEIEQWDAVAKTAAVWVRVPEIKGNSRQEVRMSWGNSNSSSKSSGAEVFSANNGYASVMHMNENVVDAVGNLSPTDVGTTASAGMIGRSRNFTLGNGVNCGNRITTLPNGSNQHSTGAWFKAFVSPSVVVGWGNDSPLSKLVIQFDSPLHLSVGTWFSNGDVNGISPLANGQWIHVAHTYVNGEAKLYVNGKLDGINTGGNPMNIIPTSSMQIGGFYGKYSFVGDIDEVRISKVSRSANWIKMEYENQKTLQTLVGNLVQPGATTFAVTPAAVTLLEGASTTLTGQAAGAEKVYWIEKRNGVDTVLATDQFTLSVNPGRVTGNQSYTIQFKAIYSTGAKTVNIPITVTEHLPDPVFTLTCPDTWDGRQSINVTPNVSNLTTLRTKGVADMTYTWSVGGVAVAKTVTTGTPTSPAVMTLTRSQGSGPMIVTLVLGNGGSSVTVSKTIMVTEPASDFYVVRTPNADEIPVTGQFYARDKSGKGQLYYNGTQTGTPTAVFLKVYTTDTRDVLYATFRQSLVAGKYAFTAPLAPGRVTYKVVYGTTSGGVDTNVNTVTDLVCGDAYIFEGQSNAVAIDGVPVDVTTDPWIRTYGDAGGGWGKAVRRGNQWTIGYFAFDLALDLTRDCNMPICIINGAAGGTRIDQHQANPIDHAVEVTGDKQPIYAKLLQRVIGAKLTHGIRGIFWHQGENNSGANDPSGDYDYKSYQRYFVDMASAWKQDYPNFERCIIFQVMPKPCAMGPKGDQLREVQRTLPLLFSKMDILNTLKIDGYLGCHFTAVGYQNVAKRTLPLVKQRYYGINPGGPVTAPLLQRASFTSSARTAINLVFDQPMSWSDFSKANYYLDDSPNKVNSGSATGNTVTLQLSSPASATATLDYLKDDRWNAFEPVSSLLMGANAIPALTFADVPIAALPIDDISALTGVTAWGSNRVDTFTIGADKNLYWKCWDGVAWSPYNSLNATATAGVGVTHWGPNRLDVFYTGNSGSMKHKWYTGGWATAEEDLGGVLVGAPAATSWAPNRIDVFCRGTDNRLWWNYFNGKWSSWIGGGVDTYTYSSPTVINWGVDRLHVFYTGIDGSIRHKWYNGSWSSEENLGGKILGAPCAVAWNNSRIDLFVRGLDSQIYWKFWNGSSWSGFNALGVFTYSDPAVTSRANEAFDIFYRGSNGVMKQKSYYLGNWSPEYDFGLPAGNRMAARASMLSVIPSSGSVGSRSAAVSRNSSALTLPWAPGNIGGNQLSGTSTYNSGTINQSGSGALGSTSDKLNFSYQTLSGDGEITAKISTLQDTGTLSGVGVMIRETLATNSKHVFLGMGGSNTYVSATRITTGGISTTGTAGKDTVPNTWVKLVRVGNVITASKSPDGKIWKTVGSTTVTMAENSYIGLAVSSGSDGVLNNSQFTNLSVTP